MRTTLQPLRRILTVGVVLLFLSASADHRLPPPQPSEVVGAWVGYSNHADFLRLELDKDGSGYLSLGLAVRGDPADVYRVRKWALSKWSLALELQPLTSGAEPIELRGIHVDDRKLECEFSGEGWARKATLFSESYLRGMAEQAKAAIVKERRKSK